VNNRNTETGSFTIEASLTLGLFVFAFVTIISLAMYATVENRIQYAINQTAIEISQYYYVLDRAGVIQKQNNVDLKVLDDEIESVMNLSNAVQKGYGDEQDLQASSDISSGDVNSLMDGLDTVKGDWDSIQTAASNFSENSQALMNDPAGVMKALGKAALQSGGTAIISRIIAPPICKGLSAKFIATTNQSADELLEKWGVLNEQGVPGGMEGLDFTMSSFLQDGRTINVIVVYRIKSLIPSFYPYDHVVCQTASTAAWAHGTSLSAAAASASSSTWSKPDIERGMAFADELRSETDLALQKGYGIDSYNQKTNTYTSYYSMNIFKASYSTYNDKVLGDAADKYTLDEASVKDKIASYVNKSLEDTADIGMSVELADGKTVQTANDVVQTRQTTVVIVIPEDATYEDRIALNAIVNSLEQEKGVKIELTYREKALT